MKETHTLKVKDWKQIFHESGNGKKAGVAVITSDKIDFKTKAITRNKERLSNSTSGYLSEETQNINLKRHMPLYVYQSIICNSQDIEAT